MFPARYEIKAGKIGSIHGEKNDPRPAKCGYLVCCSLAFLSYYLLVSVFVIIEVELVMFPLVLDWSV